MAEQNSCGCCEGKSETVEHTVVSEEGQIEAEAKEPQTVQVTVEGVRKVMANKSQVGKTQQMKALLRKYGADKLSGVSWSSTKPYLPKRRLSNGEPCIIISIFFKAMDELNPIGQIGRRDC